MSENTQTEYFLSSEAGEAQQSRLDATMELPKDRYQVRCIEEEAKTFSSGNRGLVQTWEIIGYEAKDAQTGQYVKAETIRWGNKDIVIKGIKLKKNNSVVVFYDDDKNIDKAKTKAGQDRLIDLWTKLGLYEEGEKINLLNLPTRCVGIAADAICGSEEYAMRKPPTSEELTRGIKQGEVITDRHGREIKGFSPVLMMVCEARSDMK